MNVQTGHRQVLRLAEVTRRTGKSRSAVYADMAEGAFPKNFRIGSRAVGWCADDIDTWIAAKSQGQD